MKLKLLNKIFSVLILISNIYFIYCTIDIISKDGGPMGWGYLILPFFYVINFGIITSLLVLLIKKCNNGVLLFLNSFILSLILFFIYLTITNINQK